MGMMSDEAMRVFPTNPEASRRKVFVEHHRAREFGGKTALRFTATAAEHMLTGGTKRYWAPVSRMQPDIISH
jgi:hypothetical protein